MGKKGSPQTTARTYPTNISFQLGKLNIALSSNSPLISQFAHQFLEGWLTQQIEPEAVEKCDILFHLDLVKTLPNLPEAPPVFVGDGRHLPDEIGALTVYEQPDDIVLFFQDGGLVRIKPGDEGKRKIRGEVTTKLLKYGRLHDLLFTSLSPYLRQQGYYLIHASAAVHEQEAFIFAGGSGCGKSTTVLNLALNRWGFLSNDTLLLEKRPDGIYALPTPDSVSIRPETLTHLPNLAAHLPKIPTDDFYYLSLHKLGINYAKPARIAAIYFPEIVDGQKNEQYPLSPALTLARLLEFSLDKWDAANLPSHFIFLEQLGRQARAAVLRIADQQTILKLIMRNS